MSDDKFSSNKAIDAALHLDGDPDRVQAYYEEWAARYNRDVAGADYKGPFIAVELLQQHLTGNAPCLLDAGCGTGLVGRQLQSAGFDTVDGFDLSEAMAQQAIGSGCYRRVLAGIDIMRAAEHYAADSYDVVVSVGVFTLGHVPAEAVSVLLDLVTPGGLLLVSTRSHYYDTGCFQPLVDELLAAQRLSLLRLLKNAPYNRDGDAHYWVFAKST